MRKECDCVFMLPDFRNNNMVTCIECGQSHPKSSIATLANNPI